MIKHFIDYLIVTTEANEMQGTAFKTNFLDLIKDLLKKQISEFKVTINDWRKMERDSKELLDNYEKVRTLLKKIKNIIICFVL